MRLVLTTCCALACFLSQAAADECRRVIAPTVIAVVAHDNIWTRKADRGMTFRAKSCKVKIGGNTYCRIYPYQKPDVYLRHSDGSGKEYTAFWGDKCE